MLACILLSNQNTPHVLTPRHSITGVALTMLRGNGKENLPWPAHKTSPNAAQDTINF